jgi:hypothetical protein
MVACTFIPINLSLLSLGLQTPPSRENTCHNLDPTKHSVHCNTDKEGYMILDLQSNELSFLLPLWTLTVPSAYLGVKIVTLIVISLLCQAVSSIKS